MLAEFSIVPIGAGSSIGDQLAEVLKIVDASGLPYKANPMGTVVEGEWDEIMKLIKKCHAVVMKTGERALATISIRRPEGKTEQDSFTELKFARVSPHFWEAFQNTELMKILLGSNFQNDSIVQPIILISHRVLTAQPIRDDGFEWDKKGIMVNRI